MSWRENPLEEGIRVPFYRKNPWPLSRPLYDFFLKNSWAYGLITAIWGIAVGPVAGLIGFIPFVMGAYVLGFGLELAGVDLPWDFPPEYFPWAVSLGWFLAMLLTLFNLESNGDPLRVDFHADHALRKLALGVGGVGGLLWAYLWSKKVYEGYYPEIIEFFYRFLESPFYTVPIALLSLGRLLALYGWMGAIVYRRATAGAQASGGGDGKGGAEPPPQVDFAKEGRVGREANADPRPGEKAEILSAIRKELVLPPSVEEEVAEIILTLRHYRAFRRRFGTDPPKGILLVGPPGTGKTSVARFIAERSGLSFLAPTPGELRSKWLGESAERVQALFAQARAMAPAVVFMDELDAVASKRGGHEEVHHAVGQLLQELDGVRSHEEPVVLIGASNHPESIDPAVLSRIGVTLTIPLPGPDERRRILTLLLKELVEAVDLERLVWATEGFSGRDLKTVVTRAARRAFTEGHPHPSTEDLLREVAFVAQSKRGER